MGVARTCGTLGTPAFRMSDLERAGRPEDLDTRSKSKNVQALNAVSGASAEREGRLGSRLTDQVGLGAIASSSSSTNERCEAMSFSAKS